MKRNVQKSCFSLCSYKDGNYGRALELFFLAEVETAHLVQRYLAIGRLDVVIAHVSSALRAGGSLDRQRRAHLATLLTLCRLHLAVEGGKEEKRDFVEWASSDTDYDADVVVKAALSVRAVALALHVAHERDSVEKCVELIVGTPALLPLTLHELWLVQKHGAMDLRLLACILEPRTQLNVAACSQRLVVPVIRATLPQMSAEDLQLAEALLASSAKTTLDAEHAETYLAVVLALIAKMGGVDRARDCGEGQRMLADARKQLSMASVSQQLPSQQQQQQPNVAVAQQFGGEAELRVSSIASGWNHSACVIDGLLHAWGKCDYGALGLGRSHTVDELRSSRIYARPQLVLFGSSVLIHSVACGGDHTLALDVDGTVWAFGLNDHGQLGTGDLLSCDSPRPLSFAGRVKAVACGHSHSCLLDARRRVWASGLDDDGQVSATSNARDVLAWIDLSAAMGATSKKVGMAGVACGFAHTAMWSVDGEIYTCGNNVYGQLGRSEGSSMRVKETVGSKCIQFASCGSFHTLAVTDLGSVYEWGGKSKGWKPRLVEGLVGRRIVEVCGGHSFDSLCRTAQGDVWYWRQDKDVEMVKLSDCRAIAAGEDLFVVACGGDRNVWTWGSASHGQLGIGDTDVAATSPMKLSFPDATTVAEHEQKTMNLSFVAAATSESDDSDGVLYILKLYSMLQQLTLNRISVPLLELGSRDGRIAAVIHLRQNRFLAAFLHAVRARGDSPEALLGTLDDWVVRGQVDN